jgi:hypothetical protein
MKITKTLISLFLLVAALAQNGNIFSQSCPTGLVSYWKMDETSGTVLTDAVNGNNATRHNSSADPVVGKIDNAQHWYYEAGTPAGAGEYATAPDNDIYSFPANSGFTISYWIKFTNVQYGIGDGQDHLIVSKGDWGGGAPSTAFWASGVNGQGFISFMLRDDARGKQDLEGRDPDTDKFNDGQWHHVACVRNGSTDECMIYVDGRITDRQVVDYTSSFDNSAPIYIGSLTNGTVQYFYWGDMDELAIFNRALSKTEIDEIRTNADLGKGLCAGSSNQSPTITTTAITSASVGNAYSYTVHATGSPSSMTYSLITAPAGMTINASSGLISWTPGSVGNFSVEVSASNGIDPADTQSFTITVTGTNPVISSTPVTSASVGEPYSYTVHANGTQAGMSYSLITSPAGMTINATSGVISWTPSSVGDFPVEVKAENGIDPFGTQSFTISVSGSSPNITSTPVTDASIGTTYIYTVHATGTQAGMTYSLTTSPAGMTINPTSGLITWMPVSTGDVSVEVKAENGIDPFDTQSFTIAVSEPVNCPDGIISLHRLDESNGPNYADFYNTNNAAVATVAPVATTGIIDGAQIFDANTKLDIPDNGTVYDWLSSESFSVECWIKTSTTAAMVFVGRYRTDYVAARWIVGTNSSGNATFELRDNGGPNVILSGASVISDNQWHHILAVRDGTTNFNRIYVDGVEEANVSKSYTYSFKADNPLTVNLGYLKGKTGDNEMHFVGTMDEVTIFNRAVTPAEVSSFYNSGFPSGHCNGTDNPPVFTSTPVTSANEDSPYTYTATVSDADVSDVLTISSVSRPPWLNFSWTAGNKNATVSGTPANNHVGDNDVVLRVSDGKMSRDQIFRIIVNNTNDAPVITSSPITSVNVGTPYSYTLTVTDVDVEDDITMTAVTLPSWLTFTWTANSKTATITGTPSNSNVGANLIDIRISDGTVTIHNNYTLTVIAANTPPVITGQNPLSVNEDQSLTILKSDLLITDVDNNLSDITIAVQAGTNYTFSGNTITPSANFSGQLNVNVKARDLEDESQAYPVIVTVNAVNDAPVITSAHSTYGEVGSEYVYTLTVTDADAGDAITMVAQTLPSWLIFSWTPGSKTATLSGTPSSSNLGANPVDISIYDGHVTVHESYSINVNGVNNGPVITGQITLSVEEDHSITIEKSDLTIEDIDSPSSDIAIVVQDGANYTVIGNTVTPDANFNGQLSVNVIAHDLSEDSPTFPVIITVNPVNDMPLITTDPVLTGSVGNLYVYVLDATDIDNEILTYSAVTLPDWLEFSPSNGVLTGIPQIGDVGQHLVYLQVSDGGNTVDKSFIITVNEVTAIPEVRNNEFIMYPVPAKDLLNIKFSNLTEETTIEIISATGIILQSKVVPAQTNIANISVEGIETGVYFCHLYNSSMNLLSRFLIVR